MHTGEAMAQAMVKAMKLKRVGPTEVARAFGVKPPSVKGWQERGSIHKKHMPRLVEYFADVVPASHWGFVAADEPTCESLDKSLGIEVVAVRLPGSLVADVDAIAQRAGLSRAELLRDIVTHFALAHRDRN